nr:hypothetical protein Iba_chr12fCG8630 [Ipomoea batatas]
MGNISSNSLDLKTWEASEMDAQDFIPWQGVRNESHERRGAAVRAKAFVFTKLSKGFRIAEVVVDRHKIGRENEAMIGSFEQDLLYGAPEHSSKDAPFSQLRLNLYGSTKCIFEFIGRIVIAFFCFSF